MKIGLIITTYNNFDTLPKCLFNWFAFRHNIKICVIDGLFNNYPIQNDSINSTDGTLEWLKFQSNNLDFIVNNEIQEESAARNKPLNILFSNEVDYIISIGADEFYSQQEIQNLIKFIQLNPLIYSFRVNYRNLTFDDKHYTDNFCPRRIWKVKDNKYKLKKFNYDDDCIFEGLITRDIISDAQLATINIPRSLVFPLHDTWREGKRSHDKVNYQISHFGHCSFRINPETNKMEFCPEFHKKHGILFPELHTISDE